MTKAQKLREIISKPGILVLPGVYDKKHKTITGYENDLLFEEFEKIIGVNKYKDLENEFSSIKDD
ncbi:MAG: hypothetical protein ACE5H1_03335 [Thermodesulfobacteriota bacterium]